MRLKFLVDAIVFLSILAVVLLCVDFSARGQTLPPAGETASPHLQTELLKTLDAAHVRPGDEITVRTVMPLEFGGIKFPAGTVVKGHVAAAEPNRLLLVFDGIEPKKNTPVPLGLSLRAVMMPHAGSAKLQDTTSEVSPSAQGGGGNRGLDQGPQNPSGHGDMLRSAVAAGEDSSDTVVKGPGAPKHGPGPVETRNGGVIGLEGVHLQVSDDPKAGAVFESDRGNKLRLEKGLQLLFVVTRPE
jgi:hypothetical protein